VSDYTEDVLYGTFCQSCGEYLGDGDGFPRSCAACEQREAKDVEREEHVAGPAKPAQRGRFKIRCSCGKVVYAATKEQVGEYARTHIAARTKGAT